jgi:hypothetical protein
VGPATGLVFRRRLGSRHAHFPDFPSRKRSKSFVVRHADVARKYDHPLKDLIIRDEIALNDSAATTLLARSAESRPVVLVNKLEPEA